MRRTLAVWAVVGCSIASANPAGVRVYPSAADRFITEGETVIPGDPGDVYATMLDYRMWTQIFPDVARVEITAVRGPDARVTLIGPDGHRDNLHFRNQPAARMVWFEDTGGHAEVWVETVFVPGSEPNTTRVHTRLFADVHGVASLVVGSADVRKQREQKIQRDLVNIRRYFERLASR